MTCHGNKTGQLEECKTCKVLGSCITAWNKNNPDKSKIHIKDIRSTDYV